VLSQRNDCIVLHFEDPAEHGLSGAGIIRGVEAESGRGFVGFGRRFGRRFRRALGCSAHGM